MTRRYVALLRAVNVGGRKLAMADLRRIAASCGFTAPRTLLTSGNLVFTSGLAPGEAGKALREAILAELGLDTDVFVRDGAQLSATLAANPFPEVARDQPKWLSVMFLDREPQASLESLGSACVRGEQVRGGPESLFVWTPMGIGESKLSTRLIERRLAVRGTSRNWNTVGKLAEALACA